jgi:hypothetical protein
MKIHHRLQPNTQKLLGPMEIPLCDKRHTRAPLGIRRQTIPQSKVNDVLTELHGETSGRHFGVNKTLN